MFKNKSRSQIEKKQSIIHLVIFVGLLSLSLYSEFLFITPIQKVNAESTSTSNATHFPNLKLKEEIPTTFYKNEIYFFEGEIKIPDGQDVFFFLAPENEKTSKNYLMYSGETENQQIKIPVFFEKTGTYFLGFIEGKSGKSKTLKIEVLDKLPTTTNGPSENKPSKTNLTYENFQTVISWKNNKNNLTKLIVSQGKKEQTIFFRQNIESYNVDYKLFSMFTPGIISVEIAGAQSTQENNKSFSLKTDWNKSSKKSFRVTEHEFTKIEKDLVDLKTFPKKIEAKKNISFSGRTKTNIYLEAAVILPDGNVDTFELATKAKLIDYYGSKIIPAGSDFTASYTPETLGIYQFEVNSQDGSAVLNFPVYPQNSTAFIPNFFDLNKKYPTENYTLEEYQKKLLELINTERTKHNLSTLRKDDQLEKMAQSHSEDMVTRNFFNHINPDNKSPNDRRKDFQIPFMVGENLASAPSLLHTHYGLMESAIHRANILNPKWTKVGIGMKKNNNGQYITTEEFSSDPPNETDLLEIKNELLKMINEQRKGDKLSTLTIDNTLGSLANEWTEKMINQDFFDFTSPQKEKLSTLVQKKIDNRTVQALILESNDKEKLIEKILASSDLKSSLWEQIGIGLKINNLGSFKSTLLFTTH